MLFMKNILTFLFLFISYIASAQIDSIEIEILNYHNSKSEIISKARRLLLDKLMLGDYQKMKEIKDYLKNNIDNKEYPTLSVQEYWLILFWTQEFDELLSSIEQTVLQVDVRTSNEGIIQNFPETDELYKNLLEKSFESKHLLEILINSSQLSAEEKDFLKLHLNYCLLDLNNPSITQDSLNVQSDKFILKYSTSPYRPFIKRLIHYKIKISDFGFGYDVFMGYGFFNGGLSTNLVDYVPFGFSVDFNYKNFDLNLGIGLGIAKLKQEIVYQNIKWEKEMKADIYFPNLSLGYIVFGIKQFNFNPFVGVHTLILLPTYEDIQNYPQLENIYFQSDVSLLAGFSINYYSKPLKTTNRYHNSVQFQGFIKLKYTYYQSGFKKEYYGLDGSMHNICLSFGGFTKRVYKM